MSRSTAPGDGLTASRWRRWAASVVSWTVVAIAAFVAAVVVGRGLAAPAEVGLERVGLVAWAVVPVVWSTLGALVIREVPGNAIGWLLLLPVADGITAALEVPFAEVPTAGSRPPRCARAVVGEHRVDGADHGPLPPGLALPDGSTA